MDAQLIAPCGMNCGICMAFLRKKNRCNGCQDDKGYNSKSRLSCIIKNCEELQKTDLNFCYECSKFPCTRLKALDKRYRLKYNMSIIENLKNIERIGLDQFIMDESERWKCETCGRTICVHRGYCLICNEKHNPDKKIGKISEGAQTF